MKGPNHAWLLVLYTDVDHGSIAKFFIVDSIKAVSAIVGESSQVVSNWYHGLIRSRNALKYCRLARVKRYVARRAAPARQSGGSCLVRGGGRHRGGASCKHSVFYGGKPSLV